MLVKLMRDPRPLLLAASAALLFAAGCGSSGDAVLATFGPYTARYYDTLAAGAPRPADSALLQYTLTLQEYERQYVKSNGPEPTTIADWKALYERQSDWGAETFKKLAQEQSGGSDGAKVDSAALQARLREYFRTDFLNLLVKYRLKVLEAHARGYQRDSATQAELAQYRNTLAVPFLTERAVIDPAVRKLYERRREEIRVAHIIIRLAQDSTGRVDTVALRAKAQGILDRALAGERFDSLAMRYSDDPATAKTGGDLYFFTAGMTAPSFEDAAYSLKPGQVYPKLVQTYFGFHIVKLLDRIPARGDIRVHHILTRPPQDKPDDTAAAYAKITAVLDTLRRGGDFRELAMRNSDDPSAASNGGDLGWSGRRHFVPEFDMVAFGLAVGETSGIVRTGYGYHIIRVTDERPPKSFDEARQELKDVYNRFAFEEDNRAFLEAIDRKHGVAVVDATVEAVARSVDTVQTTSSAGWFTPIPADVRRLPLVTLTGRPVTVESAIATIERNRDLQSKPLSRASLRDLAGVIGRKEALDMETADIETRYPEFGELMQEYREGVLLFKAEEGAVWNMVSVKDDALNAYWAAHAADYMWPDRVRFSEIFVASDSLARVLRDSCNAADFGDLAARHTERAGYKEKRGDWGLQPEAANDLAKQAFRLQNGWIEGPFKSSYGFSIIKVTDKENARQKTFEEARSEASSRFQEYESRRLEKEWIDGLMTKFQVTVHPEALINAFSGSR
jgi:peptidyl-prolyl cis-trans isomerase SurA